MDAFQKTLEAERAEKTAKGESDHCYNLQMRNSGKVKRVPKMRRHDCWFYLPSCFACDYDCQIDCIFQWVGSTGLTFCRYMSISSLEALRTKMTAT